MRGARYVRWAGEVTNPDFNLTAGQWFGWGAANVHDIWIWTTAEATYLIADMTGNEFLDDFDTVIRLDGPVVITQADFMAGNFVAEFGGMGADTWHGGEANDLYFGLGGADVADAGGGADTVYGAEGDDTLSGGDGDDLLLGEAGNDVLYGGAGDDRLYAGMNLNALADAGATNRLYGEGGNDVLIGEMGSDLLDGGEGDDTLSGGSDEGAAHAGDTLLGGAGNDTISVNGDIADGGEGDDRLLMLHPSTGGASDLTGGAGADQFEVMLGGNFGRRAPDMIRDFDVLEGDRIDLGLAPSTPPRVFRGAVTTAGFTMTQGAVFSDDNFGAEFQQVWTWFGDGKTYMIVDIDRNGLLGQADYVLTFQDNLTLTRDAFTARSLSLVAVGTRDADIFVGGAERDVFYGLDGDDTASGHDGSDTLYGNNGDDVLNGDGDQDFLYGGAGSDLLRGGEGPDQLFGGAGADVLFGGEGNDVITTTGNDIPDQDAPGTVNIVYGEGGRDTIQGGEADRIFGGEGNDIIYGGAFVDGGAGDDNLTAIPLNDTTLMGGAGDDFIYGGFGNDILIGGSGDDALNGDNGYDIAVYAGARGGYATATYSGVTGGVEGGIDTISGVEALAFVDGQLTFHRDGIAAQVMRLYDSAFNRIPDASGFEAQLDAMERGTSLNALAQLFVDSVEFQNTYGSLTNRQFVEQLYRNVLNREGDTAGINNAVNALTGGQTRGQLLVAFSESVEHMNLTQGTLDQGLWIADDQTLIIARLYDAAWNRLPDEGGLITWRNALGGGTSLQAIADAFAGATEFTNTYGTLTDRQFVEQLYRNVLDREGDAGGIQNALNSLQSQGGTMTRGQVMLAFSESVEHISLTRSLWIGGVRLYGSSSAPIEAKGADEPLTLPGVDEFVSLFDKSDDGALVLPGVDDALIWAKEADVALVLPGIDDGSTLVTPDLAQSLDVSLDDAFHGLRNEGWLH